MIGLATIAALRALAPDCRITAMARYPQQQAMARKLGADEVIAQEDPYETVARITDARLYTGLFNNRTLVGGFDVVYDCVGTGKTVQDSLRWTRAGGAVVLAGVHVGQHGMVGARALATRDVRPYHVNVGMPAKSVRVKSIAPAEFQPDINVPHED